MPTARHVPKRTCVACHEGHAKREMTRVVRGIDGTVDLDPTGKRSGRGAYVCRQATCWDLALKKRGLDRALKVDINDEQRARLMEVARQLTGASVVAGA